MAEPGKGGGDVGGLEALYSRGVAERDQIKEKRRDPDKLPFQTRESADETETEWGADRQQFSDRGIKRHTRASLDVL